MYISRKTRLYAGPVAAVRCVHSYFCGGLLAYLTGDEVVIPTMVIAGAGDNMRTSPILMP